MEITTQGGIDRTEGHSNYRQFGHYHSDETGTGHCATVDIVFRRAVNDPLGVVEINGEPFFAFSI